MASFSILVLYVYFVGIMPKSLNIVYVYFCLALVHKQLGYLQEGWLRNRIKTNAWNGRIVFKTAYINN